MALLSPFLISHFDLFGLRQVYLQRKGQVYTHSSFRTPLLYQLVRHPMSMSASLLLFAATTTVYILIALRLEEHDLADDYDDTDKTYQQQLPRLLPRPRLFWVSVCSPKRIPPHEATQIQQAPLHGGVDLQALHKF